MEHRELDDPQERETLVDRRLAQLKAERAEDGAGGVAIGGLEEQKVARFSRHRLQHGREFGGGHELGHRTVDFATLLDLEPGQTLGSPVLRQIGELIDAVAGEVGAAGQAQTLHALGLEHAGFGLFEDLRELHELHVEAHVGLVGAVFLHGLLPRHLRNYVHRTRTGNRFSRGEDGLGDALVHIFLRDKAHLGVELGELELAVSTEVFVSHTAGDLEVPVGARDHQELLEQLRRLRQCVEAARRQAAWNDKLTGTFRCRRHEHRCFDLGEPLVVHAQADGPVDLGADLEVALHALAAKVEVAVLQAQVFVDLRTAVAVVEREHRRFGDVEDLDAAVLQLDFTGGEVGIDGFGGTGGDGSRDPHDILIAQVSGTVDDTLQQTGSGRAGR